MAQAIPSMVGKTCVVTGATQGIGRVTALALARAGARAIVVARNAEKGRALLAELGDSAQLVVADLSALAEVRRAADEIRASAGRIDVLVNNAGALFMERIVTADGYEATFATNHLSCFLLTNLLLPTLKISAPARVVNVASDAHYRGKIDFDDLMGEKRYRGFPAYAQSKLANVMFTFELARRLADTGVTANCLHPGVVRTGFGKGDHTGPARQLFKLLGPFLLSAEQGAETQIYLATSPDVENVTGKYFDKKRVKRSSRASTDEAAQRRLWDVSEELVNPAPGTRRT